MRNYVALIRDHSASMRGLNEAARRDYNETINGIRQGSIDNNQDTLVTVLELGYDQTELVRVVTRGQAVTALLPLDRYVANGAGTPLFDAVGDAITQLQSMDKVTDPDIAYVVMVTTDGQENRSKRYTAYTIAQMIRQLQATDRWTFVFRVPRGDAAALVRLGIPAANILEWEQTQHGVEVASVATRNAYTNYFAARSTGQTSTPKFFANLSNVSSSQVEAALVDISSKVLLWPVSKADDKAEIRPFVEKRLGRALRKGAAFYQLTKSEEVQEYKIIIIRDKTTNAIYGGARAKQMLGLPTYGKFRLAPDKLGNFDVFVQSTSVNRKLAANTNVLYWEEAGV